MTPDQPESMEPTKTKADHICNQNPQPKLNTTPRTPGHDCHHTNKSLDPNSTAPQFLQHYVDKWACQQSLERDYENHRKISAKTVDLVAERAVIDMPLTRFEFTPLPTTGLDPIVKDGTSEPLFRSALLAEDLSYSLRNFLVVDPVDGPDALFARIAVKEDYAMLGYVPPLPELGRSLEGEKAEMDSERGTYGSQ